MTKRRKNVDCTVEEALGDFDELDMVFIREGKKCHIFGAEDIDHIGADLLEKPVKHKSLKLTKRGGFVVDITV